MLVSMFVQGAVRGGDELDVQSAQLAGTAVISSALSSCSCAPGAEATCLALGRLGLTGLRSCKHLRVPNVSSSACSLNGQLAVTAVTAAQGTAGTLRYRPGATSSTAGLACPLHDACRPWP